VLCVSEEIFAFGLLSTTRTLGTLRKELMIFGHTKESYIMLGRIMTSYCFYLETMV
jgi:hypothetical protein